MPNPNPTQSEEFKRKRFHAYGENEIEIPLAKKITALRLPQDVFDALEKMPAKERVIYLRSLIADAVRKDLIDSDQ